MFSLKVFFLLAAVLAVVASHPTKNEVSKPEPRRTCYVVNRHGPLVSKCRNRRSLGDEEINQFVENAAEELPFDDVEEPEGKKICGTVQKGKHHVTVCYGRGKRSLNDEEIDHIAENSVQDLPADLDEELPEGRKVCVRVQSVEGRLFYYVFNC